MTRPSSPKLQGYLDSSSLDPLATSLGDENVNPQAFDQSPPTRLPQSSPQKAMRIVEDISLSSPYGLKRRTSQALSSSPKKVSYQNLSPWKIKVTVEAEPEEMRIPNGRITTKTLKVPLREDSPETGFIRGRGRGSRVGSPGTKRRSTPVRAARSTSRSRRQSVTDLDITVLGDEDDLNEWSPRKSKKRGRPRGKKSKQEQEQQAVPEITPDGQVDDGTAAKDGRDISEDPGFEIRPDFDAGDSVPIPAEIEEDSPQLRKIDLNRVSVRSRTGPPKGHRSRCQKDNADNCSPAVRPPVSALETEHVLSRVMANSYPTPTSSIQGGSDDVQSEASDPTEHHEGLDTILESEGFTMIDLESIPSTRNLVSPPSEQDGEKAGQIETLAHNSSFDIPLSEPPPPISLPPISPPVTQNQPRPRPIAIPSYLTLAEGDSDLSSTVPSSPPMPAHTHLVPPSNARSPQTGLTPEPYSSPRLPSPPRASAAPNCLQVTRTQTSTPPKLARVVRAGIALQGVLSPRAASSKSEAKSLVIARGTPKQRLDDLFEGFDSGTRRELRAGLRLGEELAKRQKSSSLAELQKQPAKASSSTQVWRGETTVQHTPITLPPNVTDMVEKRACPTATTTLVETKPLNGVRNTSHAGVTTPLQSRNQASTSDYLNTQAKEREWQLEREAVSKQIENASPSQVVVIDSDEIEANTDQLADGKRLSPCTGSDREKDRDMDETDGDIWLAEAEAHNSSQHQMDGPAPDLFPASEQERQRERAREVVNKPRRGLIPSPWKRGEDIDGTSTIMSNGDVSGLLWKQPSSSARFGAGAIKRQILGKSDAFGSASSKPDTPLRLRQDAEAAKLVLNSNERDFSSVAHEIEDDEKDDDVRLDETPPEQEKRNAENDSIQSLVDESVCESNDEDEPEPGEDSCGETTSGQDTSPPPIKIPVKFNDSTTSVPPLTPLFLPNTPQSSRPSTPRSALKGSRLSHGLEDASERKVVFSSQSFCVDESGQKSNTRIKSLSPTPPPSAIPGVVERLQPALPPPTLSRGKLDHEQEPQPESAPKSWLGWFFGGSKTSSPAPTTPSTLAVVDGVSDNVNADPGWVATKSSIVSCRRNSAKRKRGLPSFLRPPSYPSDPTRDVSVPLATSGEFTDVHFRTLHIIYRKSLRRSFHAPDTIRPGLQKIIGDKFDCDEGEYGYFAWEVDHDAVVVLERFMQEVELGWEGKKNVMWDWSEKELCGRLFRIIVGEEVRREQSWRREHDRKEKKSAERPTA